MLFVEENYPYKVRVTKEVNRVLEENMDSVVGWLKENIKEDEYEYTFYYRHSWTCFYFTNEEDAALFSLTWT
jgi:hypothetical protein